MRHVDHALGEPGATLLIIFDTLQAGRHGARHEQATRHIDLGEGGIVTEEVAAFGQFDHLIAIAIDAPSRQAGPQPRRPGAQPLAGGDDPLAQHIERQRDEQAQPKPD